VVNHPSRRGFDPRPLRFEQGVIAFVLLIGFTFQADLLIPIVTAVLAVSGAVGPRRAPLPRLFSAVARGRLEPPDAFVDLQTVRLSVLVQTSALVVASALVFIDLGFLAWIIALAVVATAAYDAATGGWIEAALYWRIARRRRP
jgi:cytochrome c biogenesis protein CcdA